MLCEELGIEGSLLGVGVDRWTTPREFWSDSEELSGFLK